MMELKKGNSLLAFPRDYVCIDIETTGLEYEFCDIIELSAARVRFGDIVETFSELVNPGYPLPDFITQFTGITDDMLSDAFSIADVLPRFLDFCGNEIVIGHNVSFDVRFIAYAAAPIGRDFLNDFVDTMRLSRKLFPDQQHHRLFEVAQYCGVKQDQQHRAEADVLTTIACYEKMRALALADRTEDEFFDMFKRHHIPMRQIMSDMQPRVSEFDETHPFYGKRFVFTGAMTRLSRKEAAQLVLDLGGIPTDSVTKDTNFLVVGNEEFVASVKNGKTSKMLKAEKLQSKGSDIHVISETYFFDVIADFSPDFLPPEKKKKVDPQDDDFDYEYVPEPLTPEQIEFNRRYDAYDFSRIAVNYSEIVPTVDAISPDSPLYGKRVVFTRAMNRMTRAEACQIVANLGGKPFERVSKGTSYLVVGDGEISPYDEPGQPTRKELRAEEWRAKGSAIQTITETEFFDMLGL